MIPHTRVESARRPLMVTLQDAVNHVLRSADLSANEPEAKSAALRAVRYACDNIVVYHRWKAYQAYTTVMINGPYTTGSVSYSSSTGIVTLTGGSWPDWARYGELRMGSQEHSVVEVISATQIKLAERSRPAKDISSSTFKLIQRRAPLPMDFKSGNKVFEVDDELEVRNVGSGTLSEMQARFNETASTYDVSAVTGDPRFYGYFLNVSPAPQGDVYFRLLYDRYPRTPEILAVSGNATSASQTVTAVSSVFTERHVGALLRFGSADPMDGDGSIVAERIITGVTSGTVATIDLPLTVGTATAFVISDAIDAPTAPMRTAILRLAEYEFNRFAGSKKAPSLERDFRMALDAAMVDDSRYTGPSSGEQLSAPVRSIVGEVNVRP